ARQTARATRSRAPGAARGRPTGTRSPSSRDRARLPGTGGVRRTAPRRSRPPPRSARSPEATALASRGRARAPAPAGAAARRRSGAGPRPGVCAAAPAAPPPGRRLRPGRRASPLAPWGARSWGAPPSRRVRRARGRSCGPSSDAHHVLDHLGDDLLTDLLQPLRVADEERDVAEVVDLPRCPAREVEDELDRLLGEELLRLPRHLQPVGDVVRRVRVIERVEVVAERDPLVEVLHAPHLDRA